MLKLRPIIIWSIGFSFGCLLVLYSLFISKSIELPLGLIWIPIVGTVCAVLATVIFQMNSLWKGICFVLFITACFVAHSTHRKALAAHDPATSPQLLEKIYYSPNYYKKQKIWLLLAENPNTPLPVLMELSKKPNEELMFRLSINVKASEESLALSLIQSTYSSCEVLKKYSLNENQVIQSAALQQLNNKNCNP